MSGLASALLRASSLFNLTTPHIAPGLGSYLVPAVYLAYLLSWLGLDQRSFGPVMEVRETITEVTLTKTQQKKRRRLNGVAKELLVRREGEASLHPMVILSRPTPFDAFFGTFTSSRGFNVLSLVVNTIIMLAVMDQSWTTRLLLGEESLAYARAAGLTAQSSTVSFRYPTKSQLQIAYRPLLAPELQSIASPTGWELSPATFVSREDDWTSEITIDGLSPGLEHEYRIQTIEGNSFPETSLNFTTFPDSTMAKLSGSHFKFVHAGAPVYYPKPYEPLKSLPPLLPLTTPYTSFSPAHVLHNARKHRLRQPAWKALSVWLEDMRDRNAWAPVKFGLIGDLKMPHRAMRQYVSSDDVRGVYETLPIFPTSLRGVSTDKLEPAALTNPEPTFTYGDTAFFRLRLPFTEVSEPEAEDWRVDLDELAVWLRSDSIFKVVISPTTLSPFFGGSQSQQTWREAVLDVLASTPNVIVLADSPYGHAASVLRKTIVEFATPSLDSIPKFRIPDRTKAREETVTTWVKVNGTVVEEITFEKVDKLLSFRPATTGAKWTSIEVETAGTPRIIVLFFDKGQPFWRLEVLGSTKTASKAVGTLAENFHSMLRRLGLLSLKWF